MDAGTPVAGCASRAESLPAARPDAFINPLVYKFWDQGIMTMSAALTE
jgi:hypothetical protein